MTDREILQRLAKGEEIQDLTIERDLFLDFKNYPDIVIADGINFRNCIFEGGFLLSNFSFPNISIAFNNCQFNSGNTQFLEFKFVYLDFRNCVFDNFSLLKLSGFFLSILECDFRSLKVTNNELDHLELVNEDIENKGRFYINSPEVNSLVVKAKSKINKLNIASVNEALISGNIDHIMLRTKKFDTITICKDSYFGESTVLGILDFNNSNFEGEFILENVEIKELYFKDLRSNIGSIKMNEVSIENAHFYDCAVLNFYWNQVKFINKPEIIRCDLINLKMSNVYWKNGKKLKNAGFNESITLLYRLRLKFKWVKVNKIYSPSHISRMKYQRDTYRQLKAASIANHNQIDALAFYKNEMNLYWKEILIEGGEKWYDRILIFLSRWVSNFGQNWFMPLVWLIGVHFIFMMCIFNWNFYEWKFPILISYNNTDFGFLGEYFQLINPIHKLPDYIVTDGGKVADFFMRIFGGYFIYHFIKASRKFLEK